MGSWIFLVSIHFCFTFVDGGVEVSVFNPRSWMGSWIGSRTLPCILPYFPLLFSPLLTILCSIFLSASTRSPVMLAQIGPYNKNKKETNETTKLFTKSLGFSQEVPRLTSLARRNACHPTKHQNWDHTMRLIYL